jgi:hypothetical protein
VNARAALALDAAAVVLALAATRVPLPPSFVEDVYANELYAHLNMLGVPTANAVPFALCDLGVAAAATALLVGWVRGLRAARGRRLATALRLGAHTIGAAALVVLAFELAWGWNYQRAPLATRLAYDPARVTDAAVAAFAERIVGILNADVEGAHARAAAEPPEQMREQLARDFAPLSARLGNRWPVALTVPKQTVADRFFEMAGVGGMYVPLTFETLLDATFLPFERPRALAHEWAHVAGFGDEGDANLIGTLVCLRSPDPLIRYSGAFWTYAELPARERARLKLVPAVRADMEASRRRFLRYYQPHVFQLSWRIYDRYLQASGVAGGVASYSRFVRLAVGTPLDDEGLPLTRKAPYTHRPGTMVR